MDDKRGEESEVAKWKQRNKRQTFCNLGSSSLYNNQKY